MKIIIEDIDNVNDLEVFDKNGNRYKLLSYEGNTAASYDSVITQTITFTFYPRLEVPKKSIDKPKEFSKRYDL